MRLLSQRKYERLKRKAKRYRLDKERRAEIKQIKKGNKEKKEKKKIQTTKIIIGFILVNCTIVEIYAMVLIYMFADLDSLAALITAVLAESLSFAVYSLKSYKETNAEEMISLERERMSLTYYQADNIMTSSSFECDGLGADEHLY